MPNGWSGGFYLARKELKKLLAALDNNFEVGNTTKSQ
jgi:hypothetical protein